MRAAGTFRVDVTVGNLREPDIVEALGCEATGRRRVRLGDGREEEWAVTHVILNVAGQEAPTVCLIGPRGGPALLGAVTLEELALGVDPVAKRLVPVTSYLPCAR